MILLIMSRYFKLTHCRTARWHVSQMKLSLNRCICNELKCRRTQGKWKNIEPYVKHIDKGFREWTIKEMISYILKLISAL